MNRTQDMMWLAGQAAGGLTYLLPVTLMMALLLIAAVVWDGCSKRLRFGRRLFCLLLPAAGVLVILIFGSLFERQPSLSFLPDVGFGVAILCALTTILLLRPAWMTSIAVSLCLRSEERRVGK